MIKEEGEEEYTLEDVVEYALEFDDYENVDDEECVNEA